MKVSERIAVMQLIFVEQEQKHNCWHFMKCGREPYGALVHHFGVCPASTERRLDGAHDGKNAGRACWVVAGSFCGQKSIPCVFARIYKDCRKCEFYILAKEEEGHAFIEAEKLIERFRT